MTPTIDLTVPVRIWLDSAQNAGKMLLSTFLELLLNACGVTEMRIGPITYRTRNELSSRSTQHFHFLELDYI